jgi:hypothetical protein
MRKEARVKAGNELIFILSPRAAATGRKRLADRRGDEGAAAKMDLCGAFYACERASVVWGRVLPWDTGYGRKLPVKRLIGLKRTGGLPVINGTNQQSTAPMYSQNSTLRSPLTEQLESLFTFNTCLTSKSNI